MVTALHCFQEITQSIKEHASWSHYFNFFFLLCRHVKNKRVNCTVGPYGMS
jgi:hypothetical protein